MPLTTINRVQRLRERLGITQKVMARLLGVTERTMIDFEGGKVLSSSVERRVTELDRLAKALARVVKLKSIGAWLNQSNDAFDGDSPADLIAKGKSDLLWQMIYELSSGSGG